MKFLITVLCLTVAASATEGFRCFRCTTHTLPPGFPPGFPPGDKSCDDEYTEPAEHLMDCPVPSELQRSGFQDYYVKKVLKELKPSHPKAIFQDGCMKVKMEGSGAEKIVYRGCLSEFTAEPAPEECATVETDSGGKFTACVSHAEASNGKGDWN